MRNRKEAQCFSPLELALLQECFDALLLRNGLERSSEEANVIAATLFKAYGRGVTDKRELIRLADINLSNAA